MKRSEVKGIVVAVVAVVAVGIATVAGCRKSSESHGYLRGEGSSLRSDGVRRAIPAGAGEPADVVTPKPAAVPAAARAASPGAAVGSLSTGDLGAARAGLSRKLLRTVDLQITVKATTEAAESLQRLAVRLGGYVGSVDGERAQDLMRYTITLRIPSERLDEAVAEAKRLAVRVEREQQKTEDVTDKYIDLDAHLRTLLDTEKELRGLLAESRRRQAKVEDIMAVYNQLTEIRTQIESIQGQLVALDKLAAFSTLDVTLLPAEAARPVVAQGWHPLDTVRRSARALIELMRDLADRAIFAAVFLLPILLLCLLLVWLLRRALRRLLRPRTGIRTS
ncbi:MAG TPA: DUF4349 domain-containing protein [Thermoanaerobaculia bacterium]|nr:DUF4349 domain-containing protein [Thermoanaerobaculia bacterium]